MVRAFRRREQEIDPANISEQPDTVRLVKSAVTTFAFGKLSLNVATASGSAIDCRDDLGAGHARAGTRAASAAKEIHRPQCQIYPRPHN